MHDFRCNMFFLVVVVVMVFLLPLIFSHFDVSAEDDMPMQHLTRAELSELAGYGEDRLSTVLITGTVVCDTCTSSGSDLHDKSPVAGVKVAVVCKEGEGERKRISWVEGGTTDEFGDFILDLPSQLHGIPQLHEACTVRLLQITKMKLIYGSKSIKGRLTRLSSIGNSIRVYTAGVIRV